MIAGRRASHEVPLMIANEIEYQSQCCKDPGKHPSLWLHGPEHLEQRKKDQGDESPEESPEQAERVEGHLPDIDRENVQVLECDDEGIDCPEDCKECHKSYANRSFCGHKFVL
jgi:hypothetical protein